MKNWPDSHTHTTTSSTDHTDHTDYTAAPAPTAHVATGTADHGISAPKMHRTCCDCGCQKWAKTTKKTGQKTGQKTVKKAKNYKNDSAFLGYAKSLIPKDKRGVKRGCLGKIAKYKNKTAQKIGNFDDPQAVQSKARIDPETGEILGLLATDPVVVDPVAANVMRFMLQSVVREILPKSRTASCLRRRLVDHVEVWHSAEYKSAHLRNLETCVSVWRCPVCAAKIAEKRKAEVVHAIKTHLEINHGSVDLLTLTCPHQRKDDLAVLLDKQAKALNSFWADRQVNALFEKYGVIGQIRALEVTHGRKAPVDNGWHPHYHVLILGYGTNTINGAARAAIQHTLYLRWANACVLAGLGVPSEDHGLRFDGGARAAKYISKWGDEVTKGHSKKARGGETPWDLLRAVLADKNDMQARALFREFAETFKGKRQLHWSKGLKAQFAIEEVSDETLAEAHTGESELLGNISADQWRAVCRMNTRHVLIEIANAGDWGAVSAYLDSLCQLDRAHG